MDSINLEFGIEFNASLVEGDIVFFHDNSTDKVYQIGAVTAKTANILTCDISPLTPRPAVGDFIFFAKDAEVNISGVLGYYASVTMELSGSAKKELFAVSTEMFPSS